MWALFVQSIYVNNLCFCVAFQIRIWHKILDRTKEAQLLEICNEESTRDTWNAKKGL